MPIPIIPSDSDESYTALLSHRPPFVVRWGITLFCLLAALLLAAAWFIRYPDRVSATGQLMAANSPKTLLVKTNGRLMHLMNQDGDWLKEGSLIAVMESTADHRNILHMQRYAHRLYNALKEHDEALMLQYFDTLQASDAALHAGELQINHQQFMLAFQTYCQYLKAGYYVQRKKMLQTDLMHIGQQRSVLQKQLLLTQQDLALAKQNFDANNTLAREQVIAPVEHRNEESKWVAKQLQIPQLENALLSNNMQYHEKTKEIAALTNEINQQQTIFEEALQQWRAQLAGWVQQYLLIAPCSGKLVLNGFLQPGQSLASGAAIGSVQPAVAGYFIAANLPQYNFGKLKPGQPALVRFSAYPHEEFGNVAARLSQIKLLPTDSGYLAKLALPDGLHTDMGNQLAYRHGLQVQVEIITENRRLLERLLSGMRKTITR
jgi:HlyD family secretion protein